MIYSCYIPITMHIGIHPIAAAVAIAVISTVATIVAATATVVAIV